MARLLCIIALLFPICVYPQSEADSLESALAHAQADSTRITTLLALAGVFRYSNPQQAEIRTQEALSLASALGEKKLMARALLHQADLLNDQARYDDAISNYQEVLTISEEIEFDDGTSAALIGLGNSHMRKGNLEKGEEYLQLNIAIAQKAEDYEGIASSYNNLGNVFNEQGEYRKAMEAYTQAAQVNTDIGNVKNAGINMANIGMIHQKLENYDDALSYFQKSDSIFKMLDFPLGQAFVLKNKGVVYRNQGKTADALTQYKAALELYGKMGSQREMSQTYQNMGNIYSDQKRSSEAISNYRKSLDIASEIKDSVTMALASQSLGLEFYYNQRLDSASYYAENAIKISRRIGAQLTEMDGYKTLSEVHQSRGNYNSALGFRLQYEALKDSLYTLEKRDLAEEIEAKYQNEQKTREIALLAAEKELQALQLIRRKNERNGIIGFSVFILLLAGLSYNQYRIKKRSNRELRELDRIKSDFFANISHEFRTPLTLIKGPIDRLAQEPDKKMDPGEIRMIQRNAHKVLGLVNQLLDLSRIDQGKLEVQPTHGDIYKCLKTAATSFDSHAVQRHMDFQVRVPDASLFSTFDRDKVEQVVYNLLSNAFKFSEDHGIIEICAAHERDTLRIEVSDSGLGIPDDHLPFIFDRFYQVDSSSMKDREGSGIGLALTKDLVELMGGTIGVTSQVGAGTQFSVSLPMKEITGAPIAPPTESARALGATASDGIAAHATRPDPPGARIPRKTALNNLTHADTRDLPTILLIEDNADMREFIKGGLRDTCRILEAENGETGLKMASAKLPDLIITDLMMPKMDGIQLCSELKCNLETSHIPIVMLTARAGLENKIEGLETGADDYLTKPFVARELLVRVRNLLQQRRRLRDYYRNSEYSLNPEKISATSLDQKFLEKVQKLLEARHADADFDVSHMQRELAMSKTQLNRKLKALTDESPRDILRNYRLKRAAQLLAQQSDTVTQIAYQVGFNNLSYFAKCFRKQYGVAPSSY